jgi:hypothetical protein
VDFFKLHSQQSPGGRDEFHENFGQDIPRLGLDSNVAPLEYKSEVLSPVRRTYEAWHL